MNVLRQLAMEFAPWIIFSLLPGDTMENLGIALIGGLVSTVLLNYGGIRKRYLFPVTTLAFFVVTCIAVILFHNVLVAGLLGVLAYGTLSALSWGSLAAGHPFTIDYAKDELSEKEMKTPSFLSINRTLTIVWAVTLTIGLGEMVFEYVNPTPPGLLQMLIPWASFAAGIAFTLWYPGYAIARETVQPGSA